MKNKICHNSFLKPLAKIILVLLICSLSMASWAQDKPIKSRMSLTVTQLDGGKYLLESLVRAKIVDRYEGLQGLEVDFSTYNDDEDAELGSAVTNADGIASFTAEGDNLLVDSTGLVIFNAYFDGNDQYSGSDTDAEIILAEMKIETSEEKDDDNNISRRIEVMLTSQGEPVEEATIFLYKKGMINPLVLGEEETDEDGKVSFEFPDNLPGDENGNLNLFCKVEDNFDHGNMKYNFSESWGAPVNLDQPKVERSLTSPSPPLWLLLTFLGLLVFIWGHYIEVVIKLIKLKKMAKVA
jgi:5-hydroxyisourate hydrolase-like protein (transthyretin family)